MQKKKKLALKEEKRKKNPAPDRTKNTEQKPQAAVWKLCQVPGTKHDVRTVSKCSSSGTSSTIRIQVIATAWCVNLSINKVARYHNVNSSLQAFYTIIRDDQIASLSFVQLHTSVWEMGGAAAVGNISRKVNVCACWVGSVNLLFPSSHQVQQARNNK